MMRIANVYVLSSLLLLFVACKDNPFDVKVEEQVPVNVQRFDLAFDSLKNTTLATELPAFIDRYSQWMPLYCAQVIRIGDVYSAQLPQNIQAFFNYPEYQPVAEVIGKTFPSDWPLEQTLTSAFSYYHYYFPNHPIPEVYTFNGGFNQSIVIADSLIGVGLDKYLGSNSSFYTQLGIDRYKLEKMSPEHIRYDVVSAHISAEHPNSFLGGTLLSEMIHQGRSMYLLNACFPDAPDSLLWAVSEQKMQWLFASERSMWEYLIDKKQLFDTKYITIQKFTGEGPFTAPFSKESPARAAVWVGYRIVSNFMKHQPDMTMEKLFEIDDYQFILNRSKYNP